MKNAIQVIHQPHSVPVYMCNNVFNPLARMSQKTGSHFVKMYGFYKNGPSWRSASAIRLYLIPLYSP